MPDARAPVSLDLTGLKCPLPVLLTRKALRRLRPGEVLIVLCTDPLAVIDIPHMARQDGHHVLSQEREADLIRFALQRAGR